MSEQLKKLYTDIQIAVPWGLISGKWYGDQSVRPILALHGWLENCGTFNRIIPILTPYASFLAIDLPGHGYSSPLPHIMYNILDYVSVVNLIMKTYGWKKVSIMGHSLSGGIMYYFASLYPHKVDVLISIDALKIYFLPPKKYVNYIRQRMDTLMIYQDVSKNLQIEPTSYSFEECIDKYYLGTNKSIKKEYCKHVLERNVRKSQKYPNKYYFSTDRRVKLITDVNGDDDFSELLIKKIAKAAIPYIIIFGEKSTQLAHYSERFLKMLQEIHPNFESHTIANGTHHVHVNDAEKCADLIIPFLLENRPLEKICEENVYIAKL